MGHRQVTDAYVTFIASRHGARGRDLRRWPLGAAAGTRRADQLMVECATLKHMSEVGIRALKQNASAVVAAAAGGDVVTITDRGRPVARMTAIASSRLAELIDPNHATTPSCDLLAADARSRAEPLRSPRHDAR